MAPLRRAAPWATVAASVRGVAHRQNGLPCQDACDVATLPDGTLVVAVADGAGSAARSDEGARLAVGTAVHVVWDALAAGGDPADALVAAFRQAREAIAAVAAEARVPSREYAATLIVAVAARDALHVAQTGDGMVVARQADGGIVAATVPQNGEYANQTWFVTMPDLDGPRVLDTLPPVSGLAVTTDGLLPIAVDLATMTPHAPFFDPLLAYAAAGDDRAAKDGLARFLESDRVSGKVDDDLTLVLAVPVAAAADGSHDAPNAQPTHRDAAAPAPRR